MGLDFPDWRPSYWWSSLFVVSANLHTHGHAEITRAWVCEPMCPPPLKQEWSVVEHQPTLFTSFNLVNFSFPEVVEGQTCPRQPLMLLIPPCCSKTSLTRTKSAPAYLYNQPIKSRVKAKHSSTSMPCDLKIASHSGGQLEDSKNKNKNPLIPSFAIWILKASIYHLMSLDFEGNRDQFIIYKMIKISIKKCHHSCRKKSRDWSHTAEISGKLWDFAISKGLEQFIKELK